MTFDKAIRHLVRYNQWRTQLDIDDAVHGNPLAESELAELREQNRVLRIAQKACEYCGPNEPRWEGGEPANLEAAAEDAHEWLLWLATRNRDERIGRCMAALKHFMRYDHFVGANEKAKADGDTCRITPKLS